MTHTLDTPANPAQGVSGQAKIADCSILKRATDEAYDALVDQLDLSGRSDAHKAAAIRAMGEKK